MNKVEIRKCVKQMHIENKELRSRLSLSLSHNLECLISEIISKHGQKKSIGGFSPLSDEPVWWHNLKWESFDYLAVVHMHEEIKLSYHKVNPEKLVNGNLSLKLNDTSDSVIPDILIIPGVAYDKDCERLGRGKGYFDSFLNSYEGIKIGVFYSYQEVEKVPTEAHDIKLDFIVTDKEIIRRG